MLRFARCTLAGLALLASCLVAAALPLTLGQLEIDDPWTQAVPPGAPTALGYVTIQNHGTSADRLMAVSSPDADHGELHEMSLDGGIMRMRPVAGPLEIPAGGKLVLGPEGLHMMLVGLKQRPAAGGKFPIRLTFEKAGTVDAVLDVYPIGSKGPSAAGSANRK